MMKFAAAVALLVCVIGVNAGRLEKEEIELYEKYSKECIGETKISEELVKDLDNGKVSDDDIMGDFLLCLGKKYKAINDAGEFDKKQILSDFTELFGAEAAKELAKKCTAIDDGDAKKKAIFFHKCYEKNAPAYKD